MTPVAPGSVMWLSSSEHPAWSHPRAVQAKKLLSGPEGRREYALLSVDAGGGKAESESSKTWFVVTPRFEWQLSNPEPGHPVHVHLWVIADPTRLARGQFDPMKANADAWCTLYAHRQEAFERQPESW